MKKLAILVGLMVLALVIGVAGTTFRADKAEAKPTDIIAFSPYVCYALVGQLDQTVAPDCFALDTPALLAEVADTLGGDVDDPDTYQDLVDATDAQLGLNGELSGYQTLWVLTFVGNDEPLTLEADRGIWFSSGGSTTDCASLLDEDCDDNGTLGDGVVADELLGNDIPSSAISDEEQVVATQGSADVLLDYMIVGPPDDLALSSLKSTIQEDSADGDCVLPYYGDDTGLNNLESLPDKTLLLAEVTDADGNALTGIIVDWDSSDTGSVDLAKDSSVSVAKGDVTVAANIGCGDDVGSSDITATAVDYDDSEEDLVATNIDDSVTIDVVAGPDSLTLAASPASIQCNGTNSSVVSATVLDSDGNPVVAGVGVRFEVVALGTASPIVAQTDESGVATSTITPLSGVQAGVTVLVSVVGRECNDYGDIEDTDEPGSSVCGRIDTAMTDIEGSTLVACEQALPTVAPPPATPVPPISPPSTGDGGCLP